MVLAKYLITHAVLVMKLINIKKFEQQKDRKLDLMKVVLIKKYISVRNIKKLCLHLM